MLTNLILLFLLQKCIRYNICAVKIHIYFHISIKIIRKLFNILTIYNYTHHSALFRVQNQEKFVVHSAANKNRKVLDSRKNGEWNVQLGLKQFI